MQPYVIEVNDVYKTFKFHKDKSNELKNIIIYRNLKNYERREVLKGICFKVRKGEAVGLIGNNGCGKSTTLKLLSKILRPNSGSIQIEGRVSSLIELGAGFHPDMTGRENIYINASIFGVKNKEVDRRVEEIIRFAELEEYIDNPVRTYSSGMYMRLAFSIAINVDADVLLIDEILAVGDAAFQTKCFNKLKSLKDAGTTIVLVSHSTGQVESLCDRAIWIDEGVIREDGLTRAVCRHYLEEMNMRRERRDKYERQFDKNKEETLKETCKKLSPQCSDNAKRSGNQEVRFLSVELIDHMNEVTTHLESKKAFKIHIKYEANVINTNVSFYVGIYREDNVCCYENSTKREQGTYMAVGNYGEFDYIVNNNNLLGGRYKLELRIYGENGILYDELNDFINFWISMSDDSEAGIVTMPHSWNFIKI